MTPPTNATDITGAAKNLFIYLNTVIVRTKPYPPNLRRIAARIIEPATGASTCAFGNHRCTINIGNLTRKAKIINIHKIG